MELHELKNMRFLGQVKEIILFDAGMGKWFLACETTACGHVKLFTARNDLRLFKTLDAANKAAVEILNVVPSTLLDEPQRSTPFVRIVN